MGSNHDLHNNVVVRRAIGPVAIGTTGTGQAGKIIDRQGFDGVEFVINYGSITATGAVYTLLMKEGDVTGTMTSVADQDMIPNVSGENLQGVQATTPRTSGVSKFVAKKIGYKGTKRYVQLGVKSTLTAATIVSAEALLFNPELEPVTAAQAVAQ